MKIELKSGLNLTLDEFNEIKMYKRFDAITFLIEDAPELIEALQKILVSQPEK